MANNITIKDAADVTRTVRATDNAGIHSQHNVVEYHVAGVPTVMASMPAADSSLGSLTETAPTTDTASSGLNGRAQRIAQRLTSLIALLPTALGVNGGFKMDLVSRLDATNDAVAIGTKTTGGATAYSLISAASTNATSCKGSAGTLYGIQVGNTNAATRYLKLYNKATAPTVGTDTPVKVLVIPGKGDAAAATAGGSNVPIPPMGIAFSLGIAFALTTGMATADTGAVGAAEVAVNLDYA